MLRRSHKKSRGGCLQCKRRHIKVCEVGCCRCHQAFIRLTPMVVNRWCDEQRPVCRLCVVSERNCSFHIGLPNKDGELGPPSERIAALGHDSSAGVLLPTPPSSTASSPHHLHVYYQYGSQKDPPIDSVINLEHIKLLFHSINATDLFSLGGDRTIHQESLTTSDIIDLGIRYPYLLYELCAFSARHLANLDLDKAGSYLHHAITLQTRAVSLFNTSYEPITQETCVPTLLFATTLGHHVFTDTMSRRDGNDFETFLLHFSQCLDTLQGVYVIFQEARPFWMKSVLADILSRSTSLTSRNPVGNRCQRVTELVELSSNLTRNEKQASHEAIRYLQVGFDALLTEHEEPGNRYQMLFLWCVLVPKDFFALCSRKSIEALIALGYYAVLLQHGRAMWQVKDAGDYMLGLLRSYCNGKIEWDWSW